MAILVLTSLPASNTMLQVYRWCIPCPFGHPGEKIMPDFEDIVFLLENKHLSNYFNGMNRNSNQLGKGLKL